MIKKEILRGVAIDPLFQNWIDLATHDPFTGFVSTGHGSSVEVLGFSVIDEP